MMTRCALIVCQVRLAVVSLLMLGTLSACVGVAREPVESLSDVSGEETIVVGRMELVPPLLEGEQKMSMHDLNSGNYINKLFLIADERNRQLSGDLVMADFDGRIEAPLEKNFFIRSSNKPFYILGGVLFMGVNASSAGSNRIYFPGGFKIPIKTGDKAVYIGTLQYHRNEFFEITKITFVDDYERANAEFKKKYGAKYSLRKALLTSAK